MTTPLKNIIKYSVFIFKWKRMINSANLNGFGAPFYNPEAMLEGFTPSGRPSLLRANTPTYSSEIN